MIPAKEQMSESTKTHPSEVKQTHEAKQAPDPVHLNSLKYIGRGLIHLWVKHSDDKVINVCATLSTSPAPVGTEDFY